MKSDACTPRWHSMIATSTAILKKPIHATPPAAPDHWGAPVITTPALVPRNQGLMATGGLMTVTRLSTPPRLPTSTSTTTCAPHLRPCRPTGARARSKKRGLAASLARRRTTTAASAVSKAGCVCPSPLNHARKTMCGAFCLCRKPHASHTSPLPVRYHIAAHRSDPKKSVLNRVQLPHLYAAPFEAWRLHRLQRQLWRVNGRAGVHCRPQD